MFLHNSLNFFRIFLHLPYELQNKDGLQTYVIPASVNVDDFNEAYIWCKKFAVPLGVASIK